MLLSAYMKAGQKRWVWSQPRLADVERHLMHASCIGAQER